MKNKKTFLGFSILSLFVLVGADIVASPGDAAIFTIPFIGTLIGLVYVLVIAFVGATLIFLNEYATSKKFVDSFIKGIISGFLIAIPTPVVGVIISVLGIIAMVKK